MKAKKKAPKSVRLSKDVVPTRYQIQLEPDLKKLTFTGEETISITLKKASKEITLHLSELSISLAQVTYGKKNIVAQKIAYNDKAETVTIRFKQYLSKGKIKLTLMFSGALKDNMRGFYFSRYMVHNEERYMATTQFEATDARRAFPCFDEPSQKAVFDVSLVIPEDKTAISNTLPIKTEENDNGKKIVTFAPTPKMSTYLLAFMAGDFEHIEKKTKTGVLVRVLTVPGKTGQAKFALDTTVRCLEFYDEWFKIPYPLNKLDMIAIPDFASLAMENWGAITFREVGLLVDAEKTSTATRELVAEVIAHELAHQWFGNLVTMEWWTDLWLNEGFASYIPYLAVSELFPEWNVWERFATDTLAGALKLDALENTHPIEVEVHHPNEIGEIFDQVSYQKGASVIRMLAEYLGEKHFREGLRYYLTKYSYGNAKTSDLWAAFEKVSKKPVKKMMAIWTGKPGYPLIFAEAKNGKLSLSQKRYFSSVTSAKKSKDKTVWPVPLAVATNEGEKGLSLMTTKTLVSTMPKTAWMKMNAHEGSLYRTAYDKNLMALLEDAQKKGELDPLDRLGLIRDLFALSEAGEMETTTALEMAELYKNETEYIVWVELVTGLRTIANLLAGTKAYEPFRTYARSILSGAAERVGWEAKTNESNNDALTRALVLGSASFFGDQKVITEAKKRFAEMKTHPIAADLHSVVYATIAREGGELQYETLLAHYRAEGMHEEKNRFLGALGLFQDKKLLSRTLAFTMTSEVRMQDRNGAFASVMLNPYGRKLGWEYLKKNWDRIGESYGKGNHLLSRLVGILNRNTTKEAYADIKKFFKTHSAPAAERTIEQTLEQIDSNIGWLARDYKKIEKWLKERT